VPVVDPEEMRLAIATGPLSDYIRFRRCVIRFSTQIKPISYIKANAAEVLDQLQQNREPIVITQNGEARAVLMDVHTYEQSQETLALLQILAHGKKQIEAGHTVPLSEAVDKLRSSLRTGGRLEDKDETRNKP
jgi:prevent-host-death family protein